MFDAVHLLLLYVWIDSEISSVLARAVGVARLFNFKVLRRRDAKQMRDEIVPPAAYQIEVPSFAVIHVRHQQHFKIFIGLDQSVREPHGFHRVHIVIYISMYKQEMTL